VPVTRVDLSSTRIRRRVSEGRSSRYLVPEAVRRIIEGEKLYLSEL
jgi:nicotinate-nucleotide adenylyltransferase